MWTILGNNIFKCIGCVFLIIFIMYAIRNLIMINFKKDVYFKGESYLKNACHEKKNSFNFVVFVVFVGIGVLISTITIKTGMAENSPLILIGAFLTTIIPLSIISASIGKGIIFVVYEKLRYGIIYLEINNDGDGE